MPVYAYRAVNAAGVLDAGTLTADTGAEGRRVLRERGLRIERFTPATGPRSGAPATTALLTRLLSGGTARRADRVAEFARHLALLLRTGVPLADGLDVLIRQSAGRWETVLRDVRDQIDAERRQIDLMVVTRENIVYGRRRQATLTRELAGLHTRCADLLDPPVPSFWERQRAIVQSVGIAAAAAVISYALRLVIWLVRRTVTALNALLGAGRFSVKRIGTLLSFAGSLVKLFVWVFAAVAILNQFGIDPAKSTGAIGLIGLIMAGMFQQIVIDFVKGLDIVAGRHYNVGDFVEVDGKHGHVVDLNIKHTRIRTQSGQELNIPNSRCIPSRRFPDGYVDNYVDFTFATADDASRAGAAIDAVCPDLNQRVEPLREEPGLAERFPGPCNRVTLRYQLRVLPNCGWVVTDCFLPAVRDALAAAGIEMTGEPTFFFVNRLETFRKLFSRRLSEDEILGEVARSPDRPPA